MLRPPHRNQLLIFRSDGLEPDDVARQGPYEIGVAVRVSARPHRADIDNLEPWYGRQDRRNRGQRCLRTCYFARV